MTSSNMCVLVFCILLSIVHSHVIKPKEFPLPPEGVTVEITVRSHLDNANPIANMKIDINELLKKLMVSDTNAATSKEAKKPLKVDDTPHIENRHGILGGSCPIGYVMRGGFCFPDDDY